MILLNGVDQHQLVWLQMFGGDMQKFAATIVTAQWYQS